MDRTAFDYVTADLPDPQAAVDSAKPMTAAGWRVRRAGKARDWAAWLMALFVVALTVSLGNWQMRRAEFKQSIQQARDAARQLPVLAVSGQRMEPSGLIDRKVRIRGEWRPAEAVFLDNRTHASQAGFHVLMPLCPMADLDPGRSPVCVIVNRGWVARDVADRNRVPTVPTPGGRVEVEGIATGGMAPGFSLGSAEQNMNGPIWQRFEFEAFEHSRGLMVQAIVVQQGNPADDGLVREWPEPANDVPKHRGYALQWYSLAALTVFLMLYFGVRRKRR